MIKRGCKVFGALMMLVCLIFVSSEGAHMTRSSIQLNEDKGIEIKSAFMTMEKQNHFLKSTNQLVNKIEIPTYEPNSCYEVVEIPDPSLKRLLSYRLYGNEWSDICKNDLNWLWDLDLGELYFEHKIKDLSGLEYATNLRRLDIFDTSIEDFTPISQLEYLTELEISNNYFYNYYDDDFYRAIGNIKSLEQLSITYSSIDNIDFLSSLINLKSLHINTNYDYYDTFNWEIISNLINLETLDLSSNDIDDISFLQSLTELKELNLNDNQVADLQPLQDLFNLEQLWISSNQLVDITSLQNLTKLRWVELAGNEIINVMPLKNLTNLELLDLDNNQIENIDSLGSMQQLYWLSVAGNQLENLDALSGLSNLESLFAEDNQIKDISGITNLNKLYNVWLYNNNISDISALRNKPNLWRLRIANNHITDFSGLSSVDIEGENQMISFDILNLSPGLTQQIGLPVLLDTNGEALSVEVNQCLKGATCILEKNELYISDAMESGELIIEFQGTGISGMITYPVVVKSNTIPSITAKDRVLNRFDKFDPLDGVTAFDEEDGDLTESIQVIENKVDVTKSGNYRVIYEVTDRDGNCVTEEISVTVKAKIINLQDNSVKWEIYNQLGKQRSELITDEELESIEELEFYTISSLEGLQYVTNLKYLAIEDTYQKLDFTPLSKLTNLEQLIYSGYEDYDVSATGLLPLLPNFTKLIYLKIWDTQFGRNDLLYLSNLVNLQTLDLSYSSIGDLSEFPLLDNLTSINLTSTGINESTLIHLSNLPNLQYLGLSQNDISSLNFIKDFAKLKRVSINHSSVTDLSALKERPDISVTIGSNSVYYRQQTITDGILEIPNPIIGPDGKKIKPTIISDDGVVDGDMIRWSGLQRVNRLSIKYQLNTDNILYNMIVEIPLTVLNNPPIITAQDQTVYLGEEFSPLKDVIAYDVEDRDITSKIKVIKNNVNMNKIGDYEVTYEVTDNYGITVTKTIIVHVDYAKEDLNQDGIINETDLGLISSFYGLTSVDQGFNTNYDLNNDGIIDLYDIVLISNRIEY
ncbi:leucine-rich repeat domain-containing protein [Turicibacter bilis]|uniref:leucine-rich repeat domain-containing protein n=1 Tax=Turicibacter bilis TaxID=2735723 RepID=UPI001BAF31CA|nr:leucine-rich repeat domain-containing protein [Turicibacter bilis]MBS3203900.1 leucine-rich repeat domain-containing protein [Turicibacter bilis]UUF11133.1 leucine-rich repeat domain-containing protein [Turicibacter bilis]